MNTVKLVTVFVEDKPGETARITRFLAEAGVNIRWVTIATSDKFGVMKFLVDRYDGALEALKKEGLTVSELPALAVEVKDQPGALHALAELLARHSVNVKNVSGFVANRRAVVLLEPEEFRAAQALLEQHRFRLLTQGELLGL